jgi:NAD(P)-dependent dehydrogenase (short-subunit alcohol dehydrogenase family)
MRLEQKTARVTGGARGIGAGIARCLADEGARVAIVDIDGPAEEKTAASQTQVSWDAFLANRRRQWHHADRQQLRSSRCPTTR